MARRSLARNVRGSIAVTTALLLPVLLGFVAFGVDLGSVYLADKRLQGATDLAAMSAAGAAPADAEGTVRRVLDENGFSRAAFALEYGTFVPDRATLPQERFRPDAAGGNALRVRSSAATPVFFARIFRSGDVGLEARSVAAVKSRAAFSVASRLASLDGGVINQLLEQTLGAGVSLSVLDTGTLATASVDAGLLADALGELSPQATYGALFGQTIDAKIFLAAMSVAARIDGDLVAASILNRLANRTARGALAVRPSQLISIPDISDIAVASPARALDLDLNLLDMLTAVVVSGARDAPIAVTLSVPPLAGVSLELLIGEGEQASMAAAPIGTRVATAQVKARIGVDLLASGPLAALARIRLPIEVVVAAGEATLDAVACRGPQRGVTLGVRTGVAKVEIGDWGSRPLAEASLARLPQPATLVEALGIKVTTRSVVSLAEPAPTSVRFAPADIERQASKTVETRHFARSLAGDLIANLDGIDVSILGLPIIPKSLVKLAVLSQITAVATPLDVVLNTVLELAGLSLGETDVRVSDVSCGGATIVG